MALEQRALGNPPESEELLRHALAIYPDHQAALEQLSEHHLLAENFEEALAFAQRMIAVYPRRHGPYLRASRAAAELGRKDEVIAFLDQATALTGPHPEIRATRAPLSHPATPMGRRLQAPPRPASRYAAPCVPVDAPRQARDHDRGL